MRPLLRAGMVVTIVPLERPPRSGDVVVFARAAKFVAHRVIRSDGETYVTCGDARPHAPEVISAREIVGRVAAIHAAAGSAQRIDGFRYRASGWLLRNTRIPRALVLRARGRLASLVVPGRVARDEPPVFRATLLAARAFAQNRPAAGVAHLASVPADAVVACLRRYHLTGFASRWLADAGAAGAAGPAALAERLDRIRVANALQAGYVERTARDVDRIFRASGIPAIFLKGAARLALAVPDAAVHFSCDVDVLVPHERVGDALAALRAAGYADREDARMRRFLRRYEQHAEALYPPFRGAPVEVHVSLVAPGYVSADLAYPALVARVREASGVGVLDPVGTAIHLLYHGRSLKNVRDVLLLARALDAFTPAERRGFDDFVRRERRDSRRVAAVVWLASALRANPEAPSPAPSYARYALAREELPFQLWRRDGVLDAWAARHVPPYRGGFEIRRRWAVWIANVLWTPSLIAAFRANHRARGELAAAVGGEN